jgi:penicillin-binding protein 1C
LAILRALAVNVRQGRNLSGGSTITQQLSRDLLGRRPRTWLNKLREAGLALYLDWRLPKKKILEYYLGRAPYGNECYGMQAASRYYFDRPPSLLSLAQSAFLTVLPRNPVRYNPLRFQSRILRQQQRLLAAMAAAGQIGRPEYQAACRETIVLRHQFPIPPAGHFCDWISRRFPGPQHDLATTLDLDLNTAIEAHLRVYVAQLARWGITNAAVVVLRNEGREVLALVGSADYWNPDISGEINGCLALRQPGSSIKPFTYGLALEKGFPASYLLPDVASHFATQRGEFTPRNYDEQFHGPVRLRTALGCSYNIPAVRILESVGEEQLLERLRRAGLTSLKRKPEHYGLGLTLGNGEVTLLELTRAYASIAGNGIYQPERVIQGEAEGPGLRIFSPEVAFLVASILSDRSAHAPAFGECSPLDLPFPCAVKTGTTKNYRDNWAMGFTRDYTVGVWVGNFDNQPMHGVSGVSGAGPIFRDVMLMLHREQRPQAFAQPEGLVSARVCPLSGDAATDYCPNAITEYFLKDRALPGLCGFHHADGSVVLPVIYEDWARERHSGVPLRTAVSKEFFIASPDDGDVFKIDPGLRKDYQGLNMRAVVPGGVRDTVWLLDGRPLPGGLEARWLLQPGKHRLGLMGKIGNESVNAAPVTFTVLP